ncbi:MAG: hypothetical protein ABJI69_00330 [Balneola sp.]
MGVYKSDSWTKASVFNPLTGDVALMTTLIGGETFLAPQEEITQETTNGNYISQWRHRVQFACSDWDAFDTLKGFKDAHIAVQAVAAAESLNCANLQWHESVQIKELRKVPKARRADGDSHFIVVLEYEGDENAAIFNNVNLLHQKNVNGVIVNGIVDSDEDGLMDGYSTTSEEVVFENGIQSLNNSAGLHRIYRQATDSIYFPIPGLQAIFSETVEQIHANADNDMILESVNFVGTTSSNPVSFSTVGLKTATLTTNSSHYRFIITAMRIDASGAGSLQCKEFCLRIDGSSEYIAG